MSARTKLSSVDGDGVIDLDARRAARAERTGPKTVRLGGREWIFRPELPMRVAEDASAGDMGAVFRRLLVDPDESAEFLDVVDPSQDDFKELVSTVYGLDLGKF